MKPGLADLVAAKVHHHKTEPPGYKYEPDDYISNEFRLLDIDARANKEIHQCPNKIAF
jgi:hypothetical protein